METWETWFPTSHLRFMERSEPMFGTTGISHTVRVLQQLFQHGETGRTQWRDVELVTPDRESAL